MGFAGGNNNPHRHKGTNCKTETNTGAVIFRINSIPTLLAICEYCCGDNPTMGEMVIVISVLKKMIRGERCLEKNNM